MNIVSAMAWPWFGPISNNSVSENQILLFVPHMVLYTVVTEFGFTLDEVTWLGNIVACVYLPTALIIPSIVSKHGIRRCVRHFQPLASDLPRLMIYSVRWAQQPYSFRHGCDTLGQR